MSGEGAESALLAVSGVSKIYGDDTVLREVTFKQSAGESVVIVGSSGSGKSTLLRCVAGLEGVDGGAIYFRGAELAATERSGKSIRGEIGMLFQAFNLFPHLTVLENITLAPRIVRGTPSTEAEDRAAELLDKVGLKSKAFSYPEELSGGQAQRVAIARALAMEPQLMLFDEPTSALDPELTKEVLDVMASVVEEGMTVTIVTHEMGFARKTADRIVFMDEGAIVEEGTADQLFNHPKSERTERFLNELMAYE